MFISKYYNYSFLLFLFMPEVRFFIPNDSQFNFNFFVCLWVMQVDASCESTVSYQLIAWCIEAKKKKVYWHYSFNW